MKKPRVQCKQCPWKKGSNPRDIPGEYSEEKHHALTRTIAEPGVLRGEGLRMMACHETPNGRELPCVGWLVQQLGPGNNLDLRLAVMQGRVDDNVKTVGPQHKYLEDTFPEDP